MLVSKLRVVQNLSLFLKLFIITTSFIRCCFNMRLKIKTLVNQPWREVFSQFNASLLQKLSPPFPKITLLKFDGCQVQDQVQLELNFFVFKLRWDAIVTENGENNQSAYFVDEGDKLPFFLRSWKHRHVITQRGDKTVIIDDVNFSTANKLTDFLFYPLIWVQFAYRKLIYRKIFG